MTGPKLLPTWPELSAARPEIVDTMRRYLEQIGCILRPGSVSNTDQALRAFAGFLVQNAPEVTSLGQVTRRHIEDYKPWLAKRPGQNKARVTSATLAHRLGTLRMFFVRIDEWGWDEAPSRVPMFPCDHPLPKALDDAAAAKLLRAAQADKRLLVRVTVEVLLRTGLRVSEYTGLGADAVVQIGAGPWLHVPVGKLREDRYLPLHPQLVTLIDEYRTGYVPAQHPLLLPRENGRALDRHTVTRILNKAGAAAGLPHIHPHQLRHTLATQAINRGMSLEAIAAMLGHYAGDPCQADHGVVLYRRAAVAGERLSNWPISAQVWSWSRAAATASGSMFWACSMRLARACRLTVLSPSQYGVRSLARASRASVRTRALSESTRGAGSSPGVVRRNGWPVMTHSPRVG